MDDYENELKEQIEEQKQALQDVEEALGAEESEELSQMVLELKTAISELESALLEMKKAKLLASFDLHETSIPGDHWKTTELEKFPSGSDCRFRYQDGRWYSGRVVSTVSMGDGHHEVVVEFKIPIRPHMLEHITLHSGCVEVPPPSYWKGGSHHLFGHVTAGHPAFVRPGVVVQPHEAMEPLSSKLWIQVSVMAIDEMSGTAVVTPQPGAASITVSLDDLVLQPCLPESDSSDDTDDMDSDTDEEQPQIEEGEGYRYAASRGLEDDEGAGGSGADEDVGHVGLGLDVFGHARMAAEAGPQTDTAHFAEWEVHSRGIASRLLARMGYVKGSGLGRSGSGIAAPVLVELLPQRQGLGRRAAGSKDESGQRDGGVQSGRVKKRRGGERSRRKKQAAASRQEREAEIDEQHQAELQRGPGAVGLFSFINRQLGDQSEAASKLKAVESNLLKDLQPHNGRFGSQTNLTSPGSGDMKPSTASGRRAPATSVAAGGPTRQQQQQMQVAAADRQALMKQEDKITACQAKVKHFQAMLERNRDNKQLSSQVRATLELAVKELESCHNDHARMKKSINGKESKEKFWGKF